MNRFLISGTKSGCGKTTVTCAILAALQARGITPTAFKCGPDYIDPMFHRAVSGIKAYNLDPFFLDGKGLRAHLAAHRGEVSVIEGAMGYYDGIGATDEASAYTVARETETPVILVVSARGAAASLGAVIEGFVSHRPDSHIRGVIFNDARESRQEDLQAIAQGAGVPCFGTMPRDDAWALPSRHLGLLTAGEIQDLRGKLSALGRQAEQTLDLDGLLALAGTAPGIVGSQPIRSQARLVRLAVARDEVFSFLYEENLEMLEALGCELVYFSPLRDRDLPHPIDGLYLCGGYPELQAQALSENELMRQAIRQAVETGLPTLAESGGFLYLHDTLDDFPMCGVIAGRAFRTEHLQRFGYIRLTATGDNLLCPAGASIGAHEFHYWDSSNPGDGFIAQKAGRDLSYACIHATDTLFAGFPHLYFPGQPDFARRLVERMKNHDPK